MLFSETFCLPLLLPPFSSAQNYDKRGLTKSRPIFFITRPPFSPNSGQSRHPQRITKGTLETQPSTCHSDEAEVIGRFGHNEALAHTLSRVWWWGKGLDN